MHGITDGVLSGNETKKEELMKTKTYMNISPLGYRVRMGHLPLAVNPRHKIGHDMDSIWFSCRKMIQRKLADAITKNDLKRMKQLYKLSILHIENNQYSNFLNGFDSEFKMPVIPEFNEAMEQFKNKVMNKENKE